MLLHKNFRIHFKEKAGIFFLLITPVLFFNYSAFCQASIGQIEAISYARPQYGAGTQNWAMAQDAYGRLYVANNEGLLVYNGSNWQLYPVPNKTILRSIAFGKDGKLYAGAQDEFGFYAPDKAGRLVYSSLKNLLPQSDKTFADVWDIESLNKEVFFRTNDKIIRLSENKLSVYRPSSMWLSLCQYNGRIFAQDGQRGLLVFHNNQWQTIIEKNILPAGFIITDIIPYHNDTCLISTTKNGLFLFAQNKLWPFILKNSSAPQHFTSLAAFDDSSFFAGTYSNGIYYINHEGNVLENISSKNGLQNNTIRCMHTAMNGYLWTGLDNGIAFIAYTNAINHLNPPAFNNGSGYGVKAINGELFFALSTGLQWMPLTSSADVSKMAVEPKTILNGQTWNLCIINNQLLAGRDDGFWKINGHQASPVSANTGFWTYQPIPNTNPLKIAAGNYEGIHLFNEENGNFVDKGAVQKFSESSRYVETDDKNIWVSHPYRGVFKINTSDYSVSEYTSKNGLPADLDIHVFKIKNQVVFATPKGIYEYNAEEDKIIPAKKYATLFGQMPIRYLKEDEKGNIWFVEDKMPGVADFSNDTPVIHFIPELKNRITSGFENIYPYNTQNVFVGAESGFYLVNYDKYRQSIHLP